MVLMPTTARRDRNTKGGFYKLALTDFRIYFEGKMLADKGCAPPRNGGEAEGV